MSVDLAPRTITRGAAEPVPPPRRPRDRFSRIDAAWSPYLFIAPFFVIFAVFGLFPLGYTAWVSLHEWTSAGRASSSAWTTT